MVALKAAPKVAWLVALTVEKWAEKSAVCWVFVKAEMWAERKVCLRVAPRAAMLVVEMDWMTGRPLVGWSAGWSVFVKAAVKVDVSVAMKVDLTVFVLVFEKVVM